MKFFFRKLQIFVFALLACSFLQASANQKSVDFLFVGFDTGETYVWEEVVKDWDKAPNCGLLAMATSAKITKEFPLFISMDETHKFFLEDVATNRLTELNEEQLQEVRGIQAKYLIIGLYSKAQLQIAEIFSQRKIPIIAFWDATSSYERLPIDLTQNVQRIIELAEAVLAPSHEIAQDLNIRFSTNKAVAIGHPAIDLAINSIGAIDKEQVKAKLPFNGSKKIISYMGGYEENQNGYNQAFILFLEGIKSLGSSVQLIVQLHPRADGFFEREMLEQYAKENAEFPEYYLSSPFHGLQAFEAIAVSSLVATHRSTLGMQSFLAGKPVIYIDLPGTHFTSFSIENGYSKQFTCSCCLKEYLEREKEIALLADGYEQSGIPRFSKEKMRSFLKEKSAENESIILELK